MGVSAGDLQRLASGGGFSSGGVGSAQPGNKMGGYSGGGYNPQTGSYGTQSQPSQYYGQSGGYQGGGYQPQPKPWVGGYGGNGYGGGGYRQQPDYYGGYGDTGGFLPPPGGWGGQDNASIWANERLPGGYTEEPTQIKPSVEAKPPELVGGDGPKKSTSIPSIPDPWNGQEPGGYTGRGFGGYGGGMRYPYGSGVMQKIPYGGYQKGIARQPGGYGPPQIKQPLPNQTMPISTTQETKDETQPVIPKPVTTTY